MTHRGTAAQRRERIEQVRAMMRDGATNKDICQKLGICNSGAYKLAAAAGFVWFQVTKAERQMLLSMRKVTHWTAFVPPPLVTSTLDQKNDEKPAC